MQTLQAKQLIEQVLTHLGYNFPPFVALLLGTMAQESNMGEYETQIGGGPARGIFQMENATFQDINDNFLAYHNELKTRVNSYKPNYTTTFNADWLIHNPKYSTAYAACSYIRHSVPHPNTPCTCDAAWPNYKTYYNGPGAAQEYQFQSKWIEFDIDSMFTNN